MPRKSILKQLFTFGGYFQVGKTANTIATTTDNLFIASYFDTSRVATYNFTSKLPLLFCITIASKIPSALFSGMSQIFDEEDYDLFQRSFRKLFTLIIRLAFFASVLIFFINEKFVNLLFGNNSFGGPMLNLIFIYWVFFETVIRGTGIVFQVFGDLKVYAFSALIEASINIGLSFYFLQIGWNLAGLALATAIARTFTIGVYWVWFLNKKELIRYRVLAESFIRNGLQNLPLILVLYLLSRYLAVNNLVTIILYSVIAVLVNSISYDWRLIYTACKERSFNKLYLLFNERYIN